MLLGVKILKNSLIKENLPKKFRESCSSDMDATLIEFLRGQFSSMRTEISTQVAQITTRLDAMDKRLLTIEDNQEKLLKALPIFEKSGYAFELIARQELGKHKGEFQSR